MGQLFSRGGLVWYGGLIGGIIAYYIQIRAKKLPIATMYDATAPALALAYAVGRLGCFLVGDDYGLPTNSWVGIAFPDGSPPSTAGYLRSVGADIPANVPAETILAVHPTQLYEIGIALVMFAILWRFGRSRLHQGQLFSLFLGLYAIERFFIEFVRAKSDRIVFGLSTSQGASLLLALIAIGIWTRQRSAPLAPVGAEPPAPGAKRKIASRAG
jgi:phosphatidylglycerol:prolipoprotein diacylglycerol transferase